MGIQMLLQNVELVRNITQDGLHIYRRKKVGQALAKFVEAVYEYGIIWPGVVSHWLCQQLSSPKS
jgi:hypothetical protein